MRNHWNRGWMRIESFWNVIWMKMVNWCNFWMRMMNWIVY